MTTSTKIITSIVGIIVIGAGIWVVSKPHPQPIANAPTDTSTPTISVSPSAAPYVWGIFSGNMPCADCKGYTMRLSLYSAGEFVDTGTYHLEETYVGKSATPTISTGTWTTLRGMPGNDNATVIELNPADGSDAQHFLRSGQDVLTLLSKNQTVISSSMNYSLHREDPAPAIAH